MLRRRGALPVAVAHSSQGVGQLHSFAPGPLPEASPQRWTTMGSATLTLPEAPAQEQAAASVRRLPHLAGVIGATIQLALVALVVRAFQLESQTFLWLVALVAATFPIHALLPRAYRLTFFGLVSAASIVLTLGRASLWVFGLGAVLIAACHLPGRQGRRLGALLGLGVLLAVLRSGAVHSPIPAGVWAVLGSLFMFRVILYVQAVGQGEKMTPARTIAYFFMVPNVAFPLFPIIDYKTFTSTYYDADEWTIVQRGLRWITRGILHLLAYRFVYHNLVLSAPEVQSLGQLVQFVLATFFLYLKVSGTFHFIVGVLHLYGFHLPETHHLYFLSTNFSDLWRRINIYWKDFMMKVVYYPAFFRLRKGGHARALLLSTALVFVATWALHAYQWFWLLGDLLFTVPDTLFWTALGALVVWQAWRDLRHPARGRADRRWNWRRGLAVATTFTALALLWSMWSTDTLGEWLSLWKVVPSASVLEVATVIGGFLALAAVAGWPWGQAAVGPRADLDAPQLVRAGVTQMAMLGGLLVLGMPSLQVRLGPVVGGVLGTLGDSQLNAKDAEELNRDYYEALTRGNRVSSNVWGLKTNKPADWLDLRETPAITRRQDFLLESLAPSVSIRYKGQPLSTNAFGMRDQAYSEAKPANTFRVATLGPSDVMGAGVGDGETWEALVEQRLNARGGSGDRRYEVLNFAVEAYSPFHLLYQAEHTLPAFRPDLVLIAMHEVDPTYMALHLQRASAAGVAVPWPGLDSLLIKAGVEPGMDFTEIRRRLRPVEPELFQLVYGRMAEALRGMGARGVVLMLREPTTKHNAMATGRAAALAAGFEVLDLQEAYPASFESVYRVAQWDRHPNALGHAAIADALWRELVARNTALDLRLPPDSTR